MELSKDANVRELESLFKTISVDLNLDLNILTQYLNSYVEKIKITSKTTSNKICRARKQDSSRSTRRCKENENFCGKRIENQKYGCIQDIKDNQLELDEFKDKDNIYFISSIIISSILEF